MEYQVIQSFKSEIDFDSLWLRMKREQNISKEEFDNMTFKQLSLFTKDLEGIYKQRKAQNRKQEEAIAKQKRNSHKYK